MIFDKRGGPFGASRNVWEQAGMTMSEYRDLPWPQKKALILKYGPVPEILATKTTIERILMPEEVRKIVYKNS